MAEEALRSTSPKANFHRLTRLLMRGGVQLLRETLDTIHSPADLPLKLANPAIQAQLGGARLTRPEMVCLYPSPGVYGVSNDFDITLIFKLFRTICSLTPPPGPRGWDDLPNGSDHTLVADLVRIKYYRNEIYGHCPTMEISDSDFIRLWKEIREALLRIATNISHTKRDEWEKSIDDLLRNPLTPNEERCIEELETWYKQDMDVKDELVKLKEELREGLREELREELRPLNAALVAIQMYVAGDHRAVGSEPTVHPLLPEPEQAAEADDPEPDNPPEINFWNVILSFKESADLLLRYLRCKLHLLVRNSEVGSWHITVECSSLQVLEGLWEDYRSGHLNSVAQEMLITPQVLEKLGLTELKLKTFISEDQYEKGKKLLEASSGAEDKSEIHSALQATITKAISEGFIEPGLQDTPTKDMAAEKEYTDEQLNYYRICRVTNDILTEGLREIFKQEWDMRYGTTLGEWKDDPSNGKAFYNKESRENKEREENARMLSTMIRGNRAEWDLSMLFYAILYSDCIYSLNSVVRRHVNNLRIFRNHDFAHMSKGQLSKSHFKSAIGKVCTAFQALGLSTAEIQQISNQMMFPTKELRTVLEENKDLKKDLDKKKKENEDLTDQLKKIESQHQDLEDQLMETGKQLQVLKNEIKETEEKRVGLGDLLERKENKLQETEEILRNLREQLKTTEERQRNLKDNLKETEERRKSLEDQLQEKEKQLKVLSEQLLNDTSPFCILPPKPSHDIAGRDVEVADITNQLQELKQADASNLSILYISGNPGSGKSQLAGLVAKRFYEKAQEDSCSEVFVMTLNAETLGTLLDSYITFARQIKCPEDAITEIHISKDLKTEDKISSLISLISSKISQYEYWLLLADNVKSLSEMHVHLPQQGHGQWGRGYLLITTQDSTCIPLTSTSIRHISVSEGMQSQEACSLLALISGISDNEIGELVAGELDYQPLALASAATYVKELRQSKRFSEFGWNDFRRKVQKGQRDATETLLTETNPCYKKSMTTATILAVKEVMQSDRIIDHALSFLCLLSSQPLNADIVVNYIVSIDEGIKDKEMIIMKLQRCSLILTHEDEFGFHIRVHQVVRDVVKSLIKDYPESRHIKTVNSAVTAFNQFIDDKLLKESSDSILQSYSLALHLKYFILGFENVLTKAVLPQIFQPEMENLGKICENHCHFQAAKKFYEFSLQSFLQKFGPKHTSVAASYNNLGLVHHKLGDFEKAKEYHELALSIYQKKQGAENVDVATSYNNLGSVHAQLSDFEKAKEYHELALSIRQKKLGPENVSVATSYNNLGSVHHKLSDFEKAEEYFELALSIRQKKLGPENVEVANSYNNLAVVHYKLGDFEKAKEYHELALSITQKKLGAENVPVATSYNNLGLVHNKLGDFKKAKEYHELALSIQKKKLGPENVDVATSYNNLGSVHKELGDFEKAKEYHELALSIRQKKLGPENVSVATSYNRLGLVHKKLGDFEKAKEYYELALSIQKKKLGPENVDVATSYNDLGSVHEQLGDFEKAKEYHELALSIYQKKPRPVRVYDASVPVTKSLVRSVHSAQDILQQAEGCHVPATNYCSRKRAGGDSLAPVINDGVDALSQSSFESSVKSSKKRKTKKE